MSPLPPGSTASAMPGSLSRSRRMAWFCTVKMLGMLIGVAWTNGTAPSHTSTLDSKQLMVLNAPPLPP